MRISTSMRAVLAVAGVITAASAGLAAPAVAAPAAAASVYGTGLYGFGSNYWGELGNGTTTTSYSPVQVTGLAGYPTQIAAGASASAALIDGTVWTWGLDNYGALGYPGSDIVSTPQQVPGLSGIVQIAMSPEGNGYAVGSDGSLWAWGDNRYGQLGNGTTSTTPAWSPVQVPGLTGITQVAAGAYYALALRSDGTVWAWGSNGYGVLGDGTTNNRSSPEQVIGLARITGLSASSASFAVSADGSLFSWGDNNQAALGRGASGAQTYFPGQVTAISGVTQVASDGNSTLALAGPGGAVWAWGGNQCGQLGDGSTVPKLAPEPIGMTGITQVAIGSGFVGADSAAAVGSDGTLFTWGCNEYGQLGTGQTSGAVLTPASVTTLTGVSQFTFGIDDRPLTPGMYGLAVGSIPGVTVPSLAGDTTTQASQALQATGLVLGTVSTVLDRTCNNIGTVINQSPAAGTSVSLGTAVAIAIGKRPPPPFQCP